MTAYIENLSCLQLLIKDNTYFNIPNSNAIQTLPVDLAALRGHVNILTWIF